MEWAYSINYYIYFFFPVSLPPLQIDLCNPSPCGVNAQCSSQNGAVQCICIPPNIGNPYGAGCQPECVINSDCASQLACISKHCRNPCQGLCGINADCIVVNHVPICSCIPGYKGDPFQSCHIQEPVKGQYHIIQVMKLWSSLVTKLVTMNSVLLLMLYSIFQDSYFYTYLIKVPSVFPIKILCAVFFLMALLHIRKQLFIYSWQTWGAFNLPTEKGGWHQQTIQIFSLHLLKIILHFALDNLHVIEWHEVWYTLLKK